MVPIRVKRLDPRAILPKYATEQAAGMDLCAVLDEPFRLYQEERKLFRTGIAIQLPPGFEAQIRPRSGLALKHGITVLNAPGTIDADYIGEIGVVLINHDCKYYDIQPGERIAQMVIAKVSVAHLVEVEELTETMRGSGGFGSTGK